jgi:valyl-tRNA synthetase
LADAWILRELNELIMAITADLDEFRFSPAIEKLYEFTWSKLADWYVEVSKIETGKDEILLYVLQQLLKLWHPFTPYVSEAIWEIFPPGYFWFPLGRNHNENVVWRFGDEVNLILGILVVYRI